MSAGRFLAFGGGTSFLCGTIPRIVQGFAPRIQSMTVTRTASTCISPNKHFYRCECHDWNSWWASFDSFCRRRILAGTGEATQSNGGEVGGVGTRPKESERAYWSPGGIRPRASSGGKQQSREQGECLGLMNEDVEAARAMASQNQGPELEQKSK